MCTLFFYFWFICVIVIKVFNDYKFLFFIWGRMFRLINELKIVSQMIFWSFPCYLSILQHCWYLSWGLVVLFFSFSSLLVHSIFLKIFQFFSFQCICKMKVFTCSLLNWRLFNLRIIRSSVWLLRLLSLSVHWV